MPERYQREVPHKRRLLSKTLAGMLAIPTLFLAVNLAPAAAQEVVVGAARIVKNNVTGTLPQGPALLLSNGKNVFQTEAIDTLANSATLLGFRDNTQLAICPFAHVELQSVNPSRSEIVIFIASGCVRFTSGELLKAAYLNTPSPAQIRTYGTTVTVTVSARGGTTVSVAEGSASVTGAGRTVVVKAGQSTLVLRGQPPTTPVPTPPAPPIVTEMDTLLAAAPVQDYGTRAAARSPAVEAPTDVGTRTFTPNVDGKIQSEIANDASIFGGCAGTSGTLGSRGTHGACESRGTH